MGVLNFKRTNSKKFDVNAPFHLKRKSKDSLSQFAIGSEEVIPAESQISTVSPPDPAPVADDTPTSPYPVPSRSSQDTARVRLGCDITREQHRRLRIQAAKSGKTILAIVEEWIERYCPVE